MRLQVIPRHNVITSGVSVALRTPSDKIVGRSVSFISRPIDRSKVACGSLLLVSEYGMKQRHSLSLLGIKQRRRRQKPRGANAGRSEILRG